MTFAQPFQDYEILDRVGAGAMGTVFKARHKKLGRIVALKVLRPSLARDTRYVDRLRREARIVAALNHPNIVTGYDLGEEGGYHFFVMEFVEGNPLSKLLAEWGIFPEDQVLRVAIQVTQALDHAFQRNVIHRDIKPGNILIDEAGTVKLTDMGLAKGPADLTLTRDGATVGTPQYISPEQARNPQDVDVRSDLYSLGATLYHMATGQPPFKGDSMAEVITQVLHEVPIAPRVINPAMSDGLALVIRKLLSKNLRLRYQTPLELLADLERVRDEQPPLVDETRLSAAETDRQPSALKLSLAVLFGGLLLAVAVWAGTQFAGGGASPSEPGAWLAALRAELAALPAPAARLQRLRIAAPTAPAGTAPEIEGLQREVVVALQQLVDAIAAELAGESWSAIEGRIAEPRRWPTVSDVEYELIRLPLQQRTGLVREQLPTGVDTGPLDALAARLARLVEARDRALQEQAHQCVDLVLPARADEKLRAGDFVGAERVFTSALPEFLDGVRRPQPERLAVAVRAALAEQFKAACNEGLARVDAVERRMVKALQLEAEDGIAALRRQLAAGGEPRDLQQAARALREQLVRGYPPSGRFRVGLDPWPEIVARLGALDRDLQLLREDRERRGFEQLADLAWRAFCDGDAEAGLAVLGDPSADPLPLRALVDSHRAALRAGDDVAKAMLRALRSARPPLPGHPRNGGMSVELRVDQNGQLQAEASPGVWRRARLNEFRFADLWQQAEAADREALQSLQPDDLRRGRLVLAMAADDLEVLDRVMASADDLFLRDEVWPRLLRVRAEQRDTAIDRALAFRRLRDALDRAHGSQDTRELELALSTWQSGFGSEASAGERAVAESASRRIAQEKVRQERLAALRHQVPSDAAVAIDYAGAALRAEVSLPPAALRGAGEGWQLRQGRLEYACASPSWTDLDRRRLDVDGGLAPAAQQAAVEIDVAMPPPERGPRLYVFGFRGVDFLLTATADDRVVGTVIEGDPHVASTVNQALRRALLTLGEHRGSAPRLLPGAVHRLQIAVDTSPGRRFATAHLSFDDQPLCSEQVEIEPAQAPTFVLLPLQDVAVTQVRLQAIEQ